MDIRFIKPFIISIQRVFETMVKTKTRVGKPTMGSGPSPMHDVSGVIGFSGEAAGCVVLSFPTAVACKVATAFAGIEIDQDHPDFADAIGELANMVAGNAKSEFTGMKMSISLPSVIMGKGHTVAHSKQSPCIMIPCETDYGPVAIEVSMTLTNKSAASTAQLQGATS